MRHCTVNGQYSQVCFRSEPFKNQSTGHCIRRGLITFAEMEALAVSHKQCGQLPTAAFFLAVIKGQANSAPQNFSKHSPAPPQIQFAVRLLVSSLQTEIGGSYKCYPRAEILHLAKRVSGYTTCTVCDYLVIFCDDLTVVRKVC